MTHRIETIAARHGFSADAVHALADALRRGGGRQAQFSHPELGGMGQWSSGGMLMIGAMNDHLLKARVAALARDLSDDAAEPAASGAPRRASPSSGEPPRDDWPVDLGSPSASGSQNGMRYAVFPEARRLAIEENGRVTLYDTQDHDIRGAAQSQGGATRLRFSSQHGDVELERLPRVG